MKKMNLLYSTLLLTINCWYLPLQAALTKKFSMTKAPSEKFSKPEPLNFELTTLAAQQTENAKKAVQSQQETALAQPKEQSTTHTKSIQKPNETTSEIKNNEHNRANTTQKELFEQLPFKDSLLEPELINRLTEYVEGDNFAWDTELRSAVKNGKNLAEIEYNLTQLALTTQNPAKLVKIIDIGNYFLSTSQANSYQYKNFYDLGNLSRLKREIAITTTFKVSTFSKLQNLKELQIETENNFTFNHSSLKNLPEAFKSNAREMISDAFAQLQKEYNYDTKSIKEAVESKKPIMLDNLENIDPQEIYTIITTQIENGNMTSLKNITTEPFSIFQIFTAPSGQKINTIKKICPSGYSLLQFTRQADAIVQNKSLLTSEKEAYLANSYDQNMNKVPSYFFKPTLDFRTKIKLSNDLLNFAKKIYKEKNDLLSNLNPIDRLKYDIDIIEGRKNEHWNNGQYQKYINWKFTLLAKQFTLNRQTITQTLQSIFTKSPQKLSSQEQSQITNEVIKNAELAVQNNTPVESWITSMSTWLAQIFSGSSNS